MSKPEPYATSAPAAAVSASADFAQNISTSELDRAWMAVESRLAHLGRQIEAAQVGQRSLGGATSREGRLRQHDADVANWVEVERLTQELVALSDGFAQLARRLDVAANWRSGAAKRERACESGSWSAQVEEGNYCRALHALNLSRQ